MMMMMMMMMVLTHPHHSSILPYVALPPVMLLWVLGVAVVSHIARVSYI